MINLFRLRRKNVQKLERETAKSLNELLIICSTIRTKLTFLEQEIEQIQDSINKLNSAKFTSNPYDPDHNNYN